MIDHWQHINCTTTAVEITDLCKLVIFFSFNMLFFHLLLCTYCGKKIYDLTPWTCVRVTWSILCVPLMLSGSSGEAKFHCPLTSTFPPSTSTYEKKIFLFLGFLMPCCDLPKDSDILFWVYIVTIVTVSYSNCYSWKVCPNLWQVLYID